MHSGGLKFHAVGLPTGGESWVPQDITIAFPAQALVALDRTHLLAYIPWNEKYLARVPQRYRAFFRSVLPHLGARTTDVHTATSAAMLTQLIARRGGEIDEAVVYAALVLHDNGWSQVSQPEIADSLDYKGLAHSRTEEAVAKVAKRKHDILGARLAREMMGDYGSRLGLTRRQQEYVCVLVRNHTAPWDYRGKDAIPTELIFLSDADRLWSYSHENFWQDTIRKQVGPQTYAYNLAVAIDGYFLTEEARAMARNLLLDREAEVAELYMMLERRQPAQVGSVIYG